MKATITYNLSDPDDRKSFMVHNKSEDMAMVIWEFVYNSKKRISYEVEELGIDSPYEAIDKVFEHFRELLEDSDINPDKLTM
jgi:hypothetical protein